MTQTGADVALGRRGALVFGGGVALLMLGYLVVFMLFHSHLASSQGTIL